MALTPIRAIRQHCIDCCCGNMAEVRRCSVEKCTLHPYRMGKRPKMGGDTQADTYGTENADSPHIFTAEIKKESSLM